MTKHKRSEEEVAKKIIIMKDSPIHHVVEQWLVGLYPSPRRFCVKFACAPPIHVGFLQVIRFLPTVLKYALMSAGDFKLS